MKQVTLRKSVVLIAAALTAFALQAGPPFNNLEGVGGVAFNPLAYTAGQPLEGTNSLSSWFNKPQVGTWYVHLGERNINWESFGVAETIGGRLELSYGYEAVRLGQGALGTGSAVKDVSKNNLGAKLLLVHENEGGLPFVPAVAAGAIWRTTDFNPLPNSNRAGVDYYLVATKLITQTPLPVLISGGLLDTDEQVTGVLGNNHDHDLTWFGNVDVLPTSFLATGFEYKQGARYNNGFRNANYWDAHVAWFVNSRLTLIGAYTFTGNYKNPSPVGLGNGLVLSAQYAF